MNKGRRYNNERKLNLKKVFVCILVLLAIIGFVYGIYKILNSEKKEQGKVVEKTYHLFYENKKWGILESSGAIVIPASYDEMIQIPDEKTPLFICTYDVNYEDGSYKTKILNEKNEQILKDYESVSAIDNFTEREYWYEYNVLRFSKNGKFGLIDFKGKVILNPEYDEITGLQGTKSSILLKKDAEYGLCNTSGKVLIELGTYTEFRNVDIENAFIVQKDGKFGIINKDGEMLLDVEYEDIKEFSTLDYYIVKTAGKWKVLDKEKGEVIATGTYDDFTGIRHGGWAIVKKSNKYGVVSLIEGQGGVEIKYDNVIHAFDDNYIVKLNNKYGIVNLAGETKIEVSYKVITYREDINGLECEVEGQVDFDIYNKNLEKVVTGIISSVNTDKAYVRIREGGEYKYYNLNFEEKTNIDVLTGNTIFLKKENDKYGFVNKNGEIVLEVVYDDATEQNAYGFAGIKKDGLWGVVNSEGKVIVEPKYDLENSTSISFMGERYEVIADRFSYYTK